MIDRFGTNLHFSEIEKNLPPEEEYHVEVHAVDASREDSSFVSPSCAILDTLIVLKVSIKNLGGRFQCGWIISYGPRIVKSIYFETDSLTDFEKSTEDLKKILNCYHSREPFLTYLSNHI